MKPHLLDLTFDELAAAVKTSGQPNYRTQQLADWVYRKGVTDPVAMTNLPNELATQFTLMTSCVTARSASEDGTIKLLLGFPDGEQVECVLIPSAKRMTACVSTQVGCAMGCEFCASGMAGFQRNLSAVEILEQVLQLHQAGGQPITNVVFMGMGEPLANYDATVDAVRALIDPQRFGLSARHITVSTIGLPKQIRDLAKEDFPITLAISLHAPTDALRQQLMPATGRMSIGDILDAAQDYFQKTKREVTIEYVMINGVNDTNVCAEGLATIAHRVRCNVNLIPFNAIEGMSFRPSTPAAVQAFAARLKKRGVNAHLRKSRGTDAQAACGQLRRQKTPEMEFDDEQEFDDEPDDM